MKNRFFITHFLIGSLAAMCYGTAMSATLAFNFSSTVMEPGGVGTLFGVGDGTEVTGTVIYDSTATDSEAGNEIIGDYFMSVPPFDLTVGAPLNLAGDTSLRLRVTDANDVSLRDRVVFTARNPFLDATGMVWFIEFTTPTGGDTTIISSDAVPDIATLMSFPVARLGVTDNFDGSEIGSFEARVTSITAVPIPSAAFLFSSGLLGLAWMRKKSARI